MQDKLTITSPDGQIGVSVTFDGESLHLRAAIGGVSAIEADVSASGPPRDEIALRELTAPDGAVLAREATLRFRRRRCVVRVADGCVVASASRGVTLTPTLPPVPVCLMPAPEWTGHISAAARSRRPLVPACNVFAFLRHGGCASIITIPGMFVASLARRPADAVMPRGIRHALHLLPPTGHASVKMPPEMTRVAATNDSAFNTTYFFLNQSYVTSDAAAEGIALPPCGYYFPFPPRSIKMSSPDEARSVTKAHAKAYRILADPSFAEAAAPFRGEVGEYACGARRRGKTWYVAGFTSKTRVLTLFFPFLDEGVRYAAAWTLDEGAALPTNAFNPTPAHVSAGDKATVRMNQDGGFVLRLTPRGRKGK